MLRYLALVAAGIISSIGVLSLWYRKTRKMGRQRRLIDERRAREHGRRRELERKLWAGDEPAGGLDALVARFQHVLHLTPTQLLEQLRNGTLTAVETLRAFQAKALQVTAKCNCITEFIWDAERRAEYLDIVPAPQRGSLHGLPISVKESVFVSGLDSTAGLSSLLDQPVQQNAVIVDALIKLGAVPFCHTNVPQTQLSFCCGNPVWGRTTQYAFPSRSPGGSSGGEGALVAAGASVLGLGTDLAGSVRVPAALCGCCGFKPTAGRLSFIGVRSMSTVSLIPCCTVGLLSSDAALLSHVMQLLTSPSRADQASCTGDGDDKSPVATLAARGQDMYCQDPSLPRVYWNSQLCKASGSWTIGYVSELPFLPATPGCRRAVQLCVDRLTAAGHQLRPMQLPAVDARMLELCSQLLTPDAGRGVTQLMRGEQVDPCMSLMMQQLMLPRCLWRPVAWLLSFKHRYLPCKLRGYMSSVHDVLDCLSVRNSYINELMQQWRHLHLDVLILPAFMMPAPPVSTGGSLMFCGMYTALFSLLNMPAGVVPVSRESRDDQQRLSTHYPTTGAAELNWVVEGSRGAEGVSLGVQVVAPQWHDETVLDAMTLIQRIVQHSQTS